MKRLIKLEGIGGGISMQVESNAPTVFPLADDIKATELFKALDFHRAANTRLSVVLLVSLLLAPSMVFAD